MNHPPGTSSRWRTSWKADSAAHRGQQELYISDSRGGFLNLSYAVLSEMTTDALRRRLEPCPPISDEDLSNLRHLIFVWMIEVRDTFHLIGYLKKANLRIQPFRAPKMTPARWWLPKPRPLLQECPTCLGTGLEPEAWGRGWAEGDLVLLAKGGPCEDCLATGKILLDPLQP